MTAIAAPLEDGVVVPTFDEVYANHVAFVWRVLRACGVPQEQLEDAAQDVFVVVHRRLAEFEGRSAITTWLFSITRRVAASHRRRQPPTPIDPIVVPEIQSASDPFDDVARSQAAAAIAAILDRMDEDKRLVFALVELEQMSVAEVARMLDINSNTAHSRLRLARAEFAAAVRRTKAAK
ncbi:MAG: sigma-70 family RNA polymerase sigma factor [Kofleriaceae bacterium]|nr:sigma-70 family RNA polymerase sigma factor [Kofleriaceae bacterium]